MLNIFHHPQPVSEQKPLAVIILVCVLSGMIFGFFGGMAGSRYGNDLIGLMTGQRPSLTESPGVRSGTIRVSEDSATVDVVKRASPSVASIVVSKDLSKIYQRTGPRIFQFNNIFEFGTPFQFPVDEEQTPQGKQRIGGGSAFIISSDGLLLTNKHVVDDTEADYTVVMNDGKEYPAKVLAKDTLNDLAIVKVNAKNLVPLEMGDSTSLAIGQTVIAIGNSLGEYSNTVTRGVVSGINRIVEASDGRGMSETIREAIQTDAAINPGNSGGPLLNLAGQVIGINTAINKSGQSIGFALPINVAKKSVESVQKYGRIIRPGLGVRYILINEEVKSKNHLSVAYGALIYGNPEKQELGIIEGGAAQKAGLVEGDIILSVDGVKIDMNHVLGNAIAKYSPGDTVTLHVLSKGKERDVRVKLEEFKSP